MSKLKQEVPINFKKPTALPESGEKAKEWQEANRSFWENHPMRYDWKEKVDIAEFSGEFYEEIDKRFFLNSKEYLPWRRLPFDALIDFDSLKNKRILEIGIGNGSHAGLFSRFAEDFVGIDITDYAVKSTTERFKIFGLNGKILKMDGEKLDFPDSSFDYVWSWGVIHHSSNTLKIIDEICRVLKPAGKATIMIYHRGWWNYYFVGLIQWLLSGDFLKGKSFHESVQLHTDGAIARYYAASDWRKINKQLTVVKTRVLGPKTDLIPLPSGKLKNFIIKILPDPLARFFTGKLKMGSFLVVEAGINQ